ASRPVWITDAFPPRREHDIRFVVPILNIAVDADVITARGNVAIEGAARYRYAGNGTVEANIGHRQRLVRIEVAKEPDAGHAWRRRGVQIGRGGRLGDGRGREQ